MTIGRSINFKLHMATPIRELNVVLTIRNLVPADVPDLCQLRANNPI